MTSSSQLIEAIALNPSDPVPYLIVADLLEEEGQVELARAYRWCGENRKRPAFNKGIGWKFCWTIPGTQYDTEFRLPYRMIAEHDWYTKRFLDHKSFSSIMQALAEHFDTVVNIPSDTVKAG